MWFLQLQQELTRSWLEAVESGMRAASLVDANTATPDASVAPKQPTAAAAASGSEASDRPSQPNFAFLDISAMTSICQSAWSPWIDLWIKATGPAGARSAQFSPMTDWPIQATSMGIWPLACWPMHSSPMLSWPMQWPANSWVASMAPFSSGSANPWSALTPWMNLMQSAPQNFFGWPQWPQWPQFNAFNLGGPMNIWSANSWPAMAMAANPLQWPWHGSTPVKSATTLADMMAASYRTTGGHASAIVLSPFAVKEAPGNPSPINWFGWAPSARSGYIN